MSREVLAGFIKIENPLSIVHRKIEAIILAVVNEGLTELEHYRGHQAGTPPDEKKRMRRVERNLQYMVEIIVPHVIGLSFLNGFTLSVESTLEKYYEICRELNEVERLCIPSYNSEPNVSSLVEWCGDTRKYKIDPLMLRSWKRPKTSKD